MSVEFKFQSESVQGGQDGAVEAIYVINGAYSKEDALDQLYASPKVPQTITHNLYGTLYREPVPRLEEVSQEAGYWFGTVRWSVPSADAQLDEDEPIVSFNTSGGSEQILQSKESLFSISHPELLPGVPDFQGAIGVSSSGVAGTQIVAPTYEWEETHLFPADKVNRNYRRSLFQNTGTVCSDVFRDFDVGEALFLGASGTHRGTSGKWEVNFRFAGSANAPELTVPGFTSTVNKRGWDYLWVYFMEKDHPEAKVVTLVPAAVFVERVYNYRPWTFMPGNNTLTVFNPLGI